VLIEIDASATIGPARFARGAFFMDYVLELMLCFVLFCMAWLAAKCTRDFFGESLISRTTIREWLYVIFYFALFLGWAQYSGMFTQPPPK